MSFLKLLWCLPKRGSNPLEIFSLYSHLKKQGIDIIFCGIDYHQFTWSDFMQRQKKIFEKNPYIISKHENQKIKEIENLPSFITALELSDIDINEYLGIIIGNCFDPCANEFYSNSNLSEFIYKFHIYGKLKISIGLGLLAFINSIDPKSSHTILDDCKFTVTSGQIFKYMNEASKLDLSLVDQLEFRSSLGYQYREITDMKSPLNMRVTFDREKNFITGIDHHDGRNISVKIHEFCRKKYG